MKEYKEFFNFMTVECGMPVTSEGLTACTECQEYSYPSDFKGHDWSTCPVCGYNWELDEYTGSELSDIYGEWEDEGEEEDEEDDE